MGMGIRTVETGTGWEWGQSLRGRDGGQVCGDGDRNHRDGWG